MKKSILDKFADFKNRHDFSNSQIVQMVTEYANSDLEFARTFFKEKYNISEHVFYKARDYAVIFCLVGSSTCNKLRIKSAQNYSRNNDSNSARGSLAHFDELIKERQNFLNSFSANDIRHIANKYVESVSVQDIAIAYDTGEFAIKRLLKKGIEKLILDAEVVKQLYAKLGASLDELLKKREANKKALLDCIEAEMKFLKMQIDIYDLYFMDSQDKPSLQDLNSKLSNAQKKYKEALQL